MKEINLLPHNIAFDYKKFIIIRLSVFLVILNVSLLLCVSFINISINKNLQHTLIKKENYLSKVKTINNSFGQYKDKYVSLKKELLKLKDSIDYYKKIIVLHRSAYTDSVVFVNTFFDDVWFNAVLYKNGMFEISGYAPSKEKFQQYYGNLTANKYIRNIKFFYVKEKEGRYVFKINYEVAFR